jgi:hypothetical protein
VWKYVAVAMLSPSLKKIVGLLFPDQKFKKNDLISFSFA